MTNLSKSSRSRAATVSAAAPAALACALLAGTSGLRAADVTYERLLNPEPQNWLMNNHDFSAQRFSPLDLINKSNVKTLRPAFAVALAGAGASATGIPENIEATPLVDDGFMYLSDSWGVVYKIDVRDGKVGRIVWTMDPKSAKQVLGNRGVALSGNLVVSIVGDGRVVATDRDSGQVVWDKNLRDQPDLELTAAPLVVKDEIVVGASGGDRGVRDWIVALDPKTGDVKWKTFAVPAPGEPGSETWKDKNNAWQTGGGAFYVTGSYDPATNITYWGSGNPVPGYDASYRPGDNLFTSSALAIDAGTGKIKWFHQYSPNNTWDYDETGTHIIIDTKVNGEDRKIISHAGRNGFNYTFDRLSGQFLKATQYVDKLNWTKGIDPKTGKPVDYDPSKDIQTYNQDVTLGPNRMEGNVCPTESGGNNFWPATYSRRTGLVYIPEMEGCSTITRDTSAHVPGKFAGGSTFPAQRVTSGLVMLDPATDEVKKRIDLAYPNNAGALSTAGGIVVTALLDGTIAAYDDETLEELWSFNLGTGITAPPMTYAVNGKQYLAVTTGFSRPSRNKLRRTPELKDIRNATMLFVFGL